MPNIPIYAENTTYIGFLKLKEETRKELRKDFIMDIRKKMEKEGIEW